MENTHIQSQGATDEPTSAPDSEEVVENVNLTTPEDEVWQRVRDSVTAPLGVKENFRERMVHRMEAQPVPVWVLDMLAQSEAGEGGSGGGNDAEKADFPDYTAFPSWDTFMDMVRQRSTYMKQTVIDAADLPPIEDRWSVMEWKNTTWLDRMLHETKSFFSLQAKHKSRLDHAIMTNPFVPFTIRAITFIFTVIALALACDVYVQSKEYTEYHLKQQPSTIMAIVVQSVATVYLVYTTYDEYKGKPIGLRKFSSRMTLILLDLLFVLLSGMDAALTINDLYEYSWVCLGRESDGAEPYLKALLQLVDSKLCNRQKALASMLFLSMVMWIVGFTISLFRLVRKVSGQGNKYY